MDPFEQPALPSDGPSSTFSDDNAISLRGEFGDVLKYEDPDFVKIVVRNRKSIIVNGDMKLVHEASLFIELKTLADKSSHFKSLLK